MFIKNYNLFKIKRACEKMERRMLNYPYSRGGEKKFLCKSKMQRKKKSFETRIPGVEPGAVERAVTPEK